MLQESCYTCDFRQKCVTMFGTTSEQMEQGCEFWDGWHELKCTSPYKPEEEEEVMIVIPLGETNYFSMARLRNNEWILVSGKTYQDDGACPIRAWRSPTYDGSKGLGAFV